ncbi:MAG: transporter, solute binding protein [Microbacteriaceae bacterium]|nr:transporter, solute binding protein [Microbacteriaceae bacterium]
MRPVALFAVSALLLTGCAAASPAPSGPHRLSIVASTDVWGDIAKQIAGTPVTITSIITDPSQDPHSYQADARVQLALSKADVVIENGGGYDDFVDTMLKGASNSNVKLLNAVKLSGVGEDPIIHDVNEHVWYDFPGVQKVVAKLTSTLSSLDPSKASLFAANEKKFDASLATLESAEARIKSTASGTGAAITEPVPLYLLEASGLVDKTPPAFSKAIEDGTDVAPVVLQQTLALFTNHDVKVLAYNEQTTGPETQQVLAAAKSAGVAIVPVTETLPTGKHYVGWMTDNVDAIAAAVGAK